MNPPQKSKKGTQKKEYGDSPFTPLKKNCPKGYNKNKDGKCVKTRKNIQKGVVEESSVGVDTSSQNTFLIENEVDGREVKSISESQYIPREHPDVAVDTEMYPEVPFLPKNKNCPKGYNKNKEGKCVKTRKNVKSVIAGPEVETKVVVVPEVDTKIVSEVVEENIPKVETNVAVPEVDTKIVSEVVEENIPKVETNVAVPEVDTKIVSEVVEENIPKVDTKIVSEVVEENIPKVEPEMETKVVPEMETKVEPEMETKVVPEMETKVVAEDATKLAAEELAIEPVAETIITPIVETAVGPLATPIVAPLVTYAAETAIEKVAEEKLSTKTKNIRTSLNKEYPAVAPPNEPDHPKSMNDFLREKELYDYRRPRDSAYDFLYPSLNDPEFSLKLAMKKEFADTKYDGEIRDIEKYTDLVCNTKFELSPHQIFIRNFMSMSTPYKSILLYHGLGTGKTCSSIGIAEETRLYYKKIGLRQKILVVASPNIQGNFRQQLFNESKLTKITNVVNPNEYTWNIESCVGNSLLREINPNSIRNLSREKLVSNINSLINENYLFMGYIQLANYIGKIIQTEGKTFATPKEKREYEIRQIQAKFNNTLIIVDEVHNIRLAEDNKNQTVAVLLMKVAKYAENMRLVLLSATPMFNSYKEIVWLTNLMNLNDKRAMIEVADVFDSNGNFKPPRENKEGGEELLVRKLTGYVSYVRDENPYLFPARIYPSQFKPENTLNIIPYPATQMNGMEIADPIEHVDIYITKMDAATYQTKVYRAVMQNMSKIVAAKTRGITSFEEMETFLYTILHIPLEVLNIAYPHEDMEEAVENEDPDVDDELMNTVIGSNGLASVMNIEKAIVMDQFKINYEYKPRILSTYGRIFSPEILPKYSAKIAQICDIIRRSEGIVLVYSQYIDGGIIPFALALEEMGFARYNSTSSSSLFNSPPSEPIDALKMLPKSQVSVGEFHQAKYIMITGDKILSPSNTEDVKYATNMENMNGSKVKVILISKAGSEGLDFKCIRQIHILEPWYNMNRIEQIIGRGVRNLSHCGLEFAKRNCQIYMHSSVDEEHPECADMYVYRVAEKKAIQIGKVTRLMKEIAVDCVLNISQTNFTAEKLAEVAANKTIRMKLSERSEGTPLAGSEPVEINIQLGDKPHTNICDYMETCNLKCRIGGPDPRKLGIEEVKTELGKAAALTTSYNLTHASANQSFISQRIRQLFRENHVYSRQQIVGSVNAYRIYPLEQIFHVLSTYLENQKNEYLVDKYGRFGYLVNRAEYYYFQPIEVTDQNMSVFERTKPVDYKKESISLELPKEKPKVVIEKEIAMKPATDEIFKTIIGEIHANYILTQTPQITTSGEKNWYKRCSQIMEHMRTVYDISEERITEYIVYHCLDTMEFEQKMHLLREIIGGGFVASSVIENKVEKYFKEKLMYNADSDLTAIVLVDAATTKFMVKYGDRGEWVEGNTIDIEKLEKELKKMMVDKSKLNRMVGYIVNFKEKEMVFKFRDIKSTVNRKGQRCDAAGKQVIVQVMEKIGNMAVVSESYLSYIHSVSLCVLLEMIMREYTYRKIDGRVYYLTPEQTLLSNIMGWSST
jgi:hypothetical protein